MSTEFPRMNRPNLRPVVLLLVVFGSLAAVLLLLKPIPQDPAYHDFADRRVVLGLPHFFDVISNLAFLLVGVAGLRFCASRQMLGARIAWAVFFSGVALVAFGSAYYHWAPTSATLAWDRAPMAVAFMGLLAALIGEALGERAGRIVLGPAVLMGGASVVHWHLADDLRLYAWVQFFPLLLIPLLFVLFPPRYTHRGMLLVGLGFYGLAKIAEALDRPVFEATGGVLAGHTVKHLLAAAACLVILQMLRKRTAVNGRADGWSQGTPRPPRSKRPSARTGSRR